MLIRAYDAIMHYFDQGSHEESQQAGIFGFVMLLLFGIALAVFVARDAKCSWCVANFCGSSAECPGGCVCAIPMGEATGHCSGTR